MLVCAEVWECGKGHWDRQTHVTATQMAVDTVFSAVVWPSVSLCACLSLVTFPHSHTTAQTRMYRPTLIRLWYA